MVIKKQIVVIFAGVFGVLLSSCDNKETYKKYHENGNLRIEAEMENGKKDGKHVEYFENGDTSHLAYWKDGKANGIRIDYYPNGSKESVTFWKNNLQEGKAEMYYNKGILKGISYWKQGKEDSIGKIFRENGQLSEVYYKKDGVLDGPFKWYYPNGKIETEGFYKDSVKVGTVKKYYDTGELRAIEHFINFKGKQTFTGGVEYNKDGTVKQESIRVDTEAEKDTISINEELKLKITLRKPHFKLTKLIVGPYDDKFNLEDTTKLQTIPMHDHEVVYVQKPLTKGQQYIRGYVCNYEILDKKENITRQSHTYFEYPYFVK